MRLPRLTVHPDGSVSLDGAPTPRCARAELSSDGPTTRWLGSTHGAAALATLRGALGLGQPPDMRGQSFAPWRPLLQDLAWSALFFLSPTHATPAALTTSGHTEQAVIDRGQTAPVDRSASSWSDGDVRLTVELDESWWNEHALASSFLRATVAVGERRLSLFFDDSGALRWSGTGLSADDTAALTMMFGAPHVR
jgi:hypothetical protein